MNEQIDTRDKYLMKNIPGKGNKRLVVTTEVLVKFPYKMKPKLQDLNGQVDDTIIIDTLARCGDWAVCIFERVPERKEEQATKRVCRHSRRNQETGTGVRAVMMNLQELVI